METQGIAVQMDQMTHSVDGAISFIEELFQNHSVIAENVTVCFLIMIVSPYSFD
jgi:hypothetical protein